MGERGKFERKLPADRRRALIDATLACLARDGHAGLSIRKISKEAGISVGLINHHYAGKDALVGHAYEALSLGLLEDVRRRVESAGPDPRLRLSAYFEATLSLPMIDRSNLRSWVVFWGLIEHSAAMTDVHDRTYAEYRALLEQLLAEISARDGAPSIDVRLAAIGLSAILDGLWLELSLNPATFSAREACLICESWADALIGGAMPHLLRARTQN